MKKNKLLIIISSLITIYAIVGFIALPKILKPQVVKIINENITQKASLEKIEFNPFLLKFSALGLKIFDEKETTIEIEKLFIDFSIFKSIDEQHISFKDLQIVNPYVNIIQYEDGSLNLQKLAKSKKEEEPKKVEEKSSSDIKFQIYRTILDNAKIKFTKHTIGEEPFKLDIDKLNYTFYDMGTYNNTLASHSLKILINKNSELEINGGLRLNPFEMNGNVSVKNFKPNDYLTYKKDILNFELNEESYLNLDFGYKVNAKDILKIEINDANLDLKNINIKQNDKSILSLKHFALDDLNLNYPENIVSINSLYFDTLNSKIINNKDNQLNLANLIKKESSKKIEATVNEEKTIVENKNKVETLKVEPLKVESLKVEKNENVSIKKENLWKVNLNQLKVKNSNISFQDITKALTIDTKDINIDLNNFELNGNDFSLEKVTIAKPTINFKDNKNSLNIVNKELLVLIEGLNSKDSVINLNKLDLNTSLTFDDLKSKLKIFTKKFDLNISTLKKEQNNISIEKIALSNPSIFLKDLKNNLKILTNSLSVNLDKLSLNDSDLELKQMKVKTASLEFNDLKNKMDITSKNINIIATNSSLINEKLKVSILNLSKPTIYLIDNKNNTSVHAKKISLKINDIYKYKDQIKISKINFSEPNLLFKDSISKTDILAKNITLDINKISHAQNRLKIVSSILNKPYVSITLGKQEKVQNEVKEEENNKQDKETVKKLSKKSDFKFDIGPIKIKNMQMTFEDKNLPIPFKTEVTKLNGNFSRLNSNSSKPTKLELEGKVDKYGYTKITGIVDINDIKLLTDTNLLFKNIAIKNFTPYSGKFVGREIESGKLNLDLKYNIKKSDLNAQNSLVISDIKFGKKVESEDAANLPLELAIALLEDSNGVIDLELPITGNVDDPEFSIAPIVWKVFTNLIIKAITSPFSLLASVLGIEADDIKSLEFEYGKSEIIASEKEALDNIAKILAKKPKLAIKIKPIYDPIKDTKALQDIKFEEFLIKKMSKIPQGDAYKEALEEIYESIKELKDIKKVKESFETKDKEGKKIFKNDEYVEFLRGALASNQKIGIEELSNLANKRVENILEYLTKEKQVDSKSIKVEEISKQEDTNLKWAVFNLDVSTK